MIRFYACLIIAFCFLFHNSWAEKRIGVGLAEIKTIKERKILVTQVNPGSPAEKAGLHPGDTIIAFNGTYVYSINNLKDQINSVESNEKAEILIKRKGRSIKLFVATEFSEKLILRIHRIKSRPWTTYPYEVYVDNNQIGEIAEDEIKTLLSMKQLTSSIIFT